MKTLNRLKNLLQKDMRFLGACGSDSKYKEKMKNEGIHRHYKFFAAFENSICPDYITEKVLDPIQWNSVPIVAGASRKEYEKHLPGSAFIHIEDYPSLEVFAEDLLAISKSKVRYDKFFDWRRITHEESESVKRHAIIENIFGPTMNRECSLVDWMTTKGNLRKEHHRDVITSFSDPRHCQPIQNDKVSEERPSEKDEEEHAKSTSLKTETNMHIDSEN